MSLDKDRIKTNLQRILSQNPPDESKLELFVDDLIDGIMTGWTNTHLKTNKEIPEKFQKYLEIGGEEDFLEGLRDIEKSSHEYHEDVKDLLDQLLKAASDFRSYYSVSKQLVDIDNFWGTDNHRKYVTEKEDIEPFLDGYINSLQADLESMPTKRKGRSKDVGKFIFVRNVYVMAHSLLDVRGTVSNSNTIFNKVLRRCYKELNDDTEECRHFIKPCFEDYTTIYNMAFYYKKYGRLDLYIEHLKATSHEEDILDLFNYDWNEWEKPHNFQYIN